MGMKMMTETGETALHIIMDADRAEQALDAGMLLLAVAIPVSLDAGIGEYKTAGAVSNQRKGRDGKAVDGTGGHGFYQLDAGPETGLPELVRNICVSVHGPLKDGSGRDAAQQHSRVAANQDALAAFNASSNGKARRKARQATAEATASK